MRIDYVNIEEFKNLEKFEIDLDENFMETVLLGQNATGKSNFIEALVLIFKFLDLEKSCDFDYIIKYRCRDVNVEVVHAVAKYIFFIEGENISNAEFFRKKDLFLPKYVFTYYSGTSNRLKEHFDAHQKRFYDKIIKPEVKKDEIDNLRRLFYVQLVHSYFVLLAYFSFEKHETESIEFLKDVLGIEDLESVLFVLHKPIWNGKGDERFWGANGLVQDFLDKVWDLSIAPIYNEEQISINFRKKTKQARLYLYISSKSKLKELSKFYDSNTDFFKALESTYISDLIEEVRIKIKKTNVKGKIKFKELSEGEQQLLTVIGLLKFTKDEESLILLDEPDTHLNPVWKWRYLQYLKDVVDTEKEATQIIINTHDPLVIGSLVKEQVRMFKNTKGHITALQPDIDPKGLGVAGILTSELFGLPSTLDEETLKILSRRNKLITKQESKKLNQKEKFELNGIFNHLNSLGINTTDRDPLYERFITAISNRDDFKDDKLSPEDIKAQNVIALEILNELLEEEKKMIYIDLDNHAPPQDWLDRADALTQKLLAARTSAKRATIIHDNQNMWTEIKQHFCDVRKRKCWYSESINDFAHCHVDHFRPKTNAIDENGNDKGGYWWLAFDWTNYRYSGPAGNVRKKDFFQVNRRKANKPSDALEDEDIRFLDPTEPADPQKLKYDNEGKVSEKETNKLHRDYIQAEYTIRRMNLNMIGLVEGRKDKFRKASGIIRQTQKLLALQQKNHSMARHQAIKAKQKVLLELAGKFSPYSAAVKYCLKASGLDWALELAIAA